MYITGNVFVSNAVQSQNIWATNVYAANVYIKTTGLYADLTTKSLGAAVWTSTQAATLTRAAHVPLYVESAGVAPSAGTVWTGDMYFDNSSFYKYINAASPTWYPIGLMIPAAPALTALGTQTVTNQTSAVQITQTTSAQTVGVVIWSMSNAPANVYISNQQSTGCSIMIPEGQPTSTSTVTVTATNSVGSASISFGLNIRGPVITAATATLLGITGWTVYRFTSEDVVHYMTVTGGGYCEYLVVGGGGGGGMDMGGGGGAGGYVAGSGYLAAGTYQIVIGKGGGGAAAGNSTSTSGFATNNTAHPFWRSSTNGGDTSITPISGGNLRLRAIGGGGGGSSVYKFSPDLGRGKDGASGGGASGYTDGVLNTASVDLRISTRAGGQGTQASLGYGLGNKGADSGAAGGNFGAGGGGAGGTGVTATGSTTATGGAGIQNAILGTNYFWAGGGGGSSWSNTGGAGGAGGGGGAAPGSGAGGSGFNSGSTGGGGGAFSQANTPGGNGGANTGGGGGGGAHFNFTNAGGNGGSGIVVIRIVA